MGYGLSQNELDALVAQLKPRIRIFQKNEIISSRNQGREQIGFVLKGMVYLCVEDETFNRKILQFFRVGDYISAAMLPALERGVSYLTAKYGAEIGYFRSEDLWALSVKDRRWRQRFFLPELHDWEQQQAWQAFMMRQRGVRERILCFLRQECKRAGSNEIELPMPLGDLAEYLGVERTAMMKELRRLKEEGVVAGARRKFVLLRP